MKWQRWFSEQQNKEKGIEGMVVSKVATVIHTWRLIEQWGYQFIHALGKRYKDWSKETLQKYIIDLDACTSLLLWVENIGYPYTYALTIILGHNEDP